MPCDIVPIVTLHFPARADAAEKHVEVKGTAGAGASVEYTTNEVRHFRMCPAGADLIVVHDIVIDTSVTPYSASEGVLVHVVNYSAPKQDL